MPRTLIRDLARHVGEEVTVHGWVNALRLQRKMQFAIVRDHTGMVQVTNKRDDTESPIEAVLEHGVTAESAVTVVGRVVENPVVKLDGVEIIPSSIEVVNRAEASLPIQEDSSIEHRLDWRFLDIRKPARRLIFDVQTTLERAVRDFVYSAGATEMHTPKLMGSASESGSEVFKVKYFDDWAFLAQSPQFYKQMAISGGIDIFFEIGPVFRAEPSFTSRHATEFTGLDLEIAWIEDVDDVMKFEEEMLRHVLDAVGSDHGDAIREYFGVDVRVPDLPFPRITMADAQELLVKNGWSTSRVKGDLDPDGERLLSSVVASEFGHEFVFVTEYPTGVRPFYHLRPSGKVDVTASFDLLWKGIEITTGAQREHRYDVLVKQAEEKGMDLDSMRHYLDSFRYGTPPHGGLGAGLNRMTMVLLGLDSIRESTFLFRGPNRIHP